MVLRLRKPFLAMVLALHFCLFVTSPALAGMVPSFSPRLSPPDTRVMEVDKIQRALENKIVQEKLQAYGLSAEEVRDKLASMSDSQVHVLAQASDKLLAGGDAIGFVVGVLLIVLLVIIILKLLNKEIIIR